MTPPEASLPDELAARFDAAFGTARGPLPGWTATDRRFENADGALQAAQRLTYLHAVVAYEARRTELHYEGEYGLDRATADALQSLVRRMRAPITRQLVPDSAEEAIAAVANLETLCGGYAHEFDVLLAGPMPRRQAEEITGQRLRMLALSDSQWPEDYWAVDNLDGERRRLYAESPLV